MPINMNETQVHSLIALWNEYVSVTHSGAEDEWAEKLNAAEPGSKQYRKAERKLAEAAEAHHEAIACLAALERAFSIMGLVVVRNEDDYAIGVRLDEEEE